MDLSPDELKLEPGSYAMRKPSHEAYAVNRGIHGMKRWDAYVAAGYTGKSKNAADIVEKAKGMWKRITFLKGEAARKAVKESTVTRNEVIDALRENLQAAKIGNETVGRDGSSTFKRDFSAVNKAAEQLGRSIGLFVDVERKEDLDELLEGKTDEELRAWVLGLIEAFDPTLRKKVAAMIEAEAREKAGAQLQ